MPAVREVLVLQIRLQFAIGQAHGYVTHAIVFIRVVACPGAIDRDKSRQGTMVDDPHGQIATAVAEMPAVQDALRSVPLGTGDDGVVMAGLIVAVLFPGVLHRFVGVKVRRPGLSGKDVAAVTFVAHDRGHAARRPHGVHLPADLLQAGFPAQVGERVGDLLGGLAIE